MAEFDKKAATWDDDPIRVQRAEVIANSMTKVIDLSKVNMAMEYGSGTGLLSFALKDKLKHVVLMDESEAMTTITKEKCKAQNISNFKPLQYDLLKQELPDERFELIYILLTMHHIDDTQTILSKFYNLLNPGGRLAIIDLDKEDGTFHQGDFKGHYGFDRQELETKIVSAGFTPVSYQYCYELERDYDDETKKYPLFLLVSRKPG